MKGLIAAGMALVLSGCIVVSRETRTYCPPPDSAKGPNVGTICAATQLRYMSDRARILKSVAGRDDLTDSEQRLMIDVAARTDLYMSDRSDILLTLASNPHLCTDARADIGRRIGEFEIYESDKVRIVEAMDAAARKKS